MEWQSQLITIYLMVCRHWEQGLWTSCQRMSNHNSFELTDPEIIAIYLFGITRHRTEIKSIYSFTQDHLGGQQNVELLTPVKLSKGQQQLDLKKDCTRHP